MLAAWDRRTDENLLPIRRSIPFKLPFRVNKQTPLSWIVLASKSLDNTASGITKYQIVLLTGKFFEFILAIAKEIYFSISVQKIPPF